VVRRVKGIEAGRLRIGMARSDVIGGDSADKLKRVLKTVLVRRCYRNNLPDIRNGYSVLEADVV